jgi:hypothetical protein
MYFGFKGGDRLKFSDVILAVLVGSVIAWPVEAVLFMVLIPSLGSIWGMNSAAIISGIVAALLVGYLFAAKIQEESRIEAVGKITVLFAFVEAFNILISFPANPYYAAWTKESLQSMFQTGSWTTMDWFANAQMVLVLNVTLNVVLTLVLGLITIYAGSMLRKPKKS